jgi:hypothetical protein
VYVTGPPGAPDDRPLSLVRAERRTFVGPAGLADSPDHRDRLRTYLTDLVRPHGIALREDLLERGVGRSYGEMAEVLIYDTVRPDEPVDLLILAMAAPDVQPGRATATYLSHVCPGGPLAFALCDQGNVTPFTAVRLAREYARTGNCRRILILVVEQSTMYYEPVAPVAVPDRDTAVALLFQVGAGDAPRLDSVRQHVDVSADAAPALFAKEIGELSAGATLILGGGLASQLETARPDGGLVRPAPPGQPATGAWWELVDELDRPGPRSIVVADHEPLARQLCLLELDA